MAKIIIYIIMFLIAISSVQAITIADELFVWNFTKTGDEDALDVWVEPINKTHSRIWLSKNNPKNYSQNLIEKQRDIRNVPIEIIKSNGKTKLEKTKLDLAKDLEYVEIEHSTKQGLKIKIGWESITIEATVHSNSLKLFSTDHLLTDKQGNVHVSYLETSQDLYHAFLANGTLTFTNNLVDTMNMGETGIVHLIEGIGVYGRYIIVGGAADVYGRNTTDNGTSWSDPATKFVNTATELRNPDCAINNNNETICIAISSSGNYLYYTNSTKWNFPNAVTLLFDSSDNTNECDLEITQDNCAIISCVGTDQDDVDFLNECNGFERQNVYNLNAVGQQAMTTYNNKIYIVYTLSLAGQVYMSNSSHNGTGNNWTSKQVSITGVSPTNLEVVVDKQGRIHVFYLDGENDLIYANSSDEWKSYTSQDTGIDAVSFSFQDTTYPEYNKPNDVLKFVYLTAAGSLEYDTILVGQEETPGTDDQAPNISIQSPLNMSIWKNDSIKLNYTLQEWALDSCWFQNYTGANNISLLNCANTTMNISTNGIHNITLYANDSSNNLGNVTVWFNVSIPAPLAEVNYTPSIDWENPTPTDKSSIATTSLHLNATVANAYNTSAFFDWNKTLVGYWSFDHYNSSGIKDNSTYYGFAQYYGGISSADIGDAKYGQGLTFDGIDDYLEVPDNDLMDWNNTLSVSVWLKPTQTTQYTAMKILDKGEDTNGLFSWSLSYDGRRSLFGFGKSGWCTATFYNISDNAWHHIAGTMKPHNSTDVNVTLYGDGNIISNYICDNPYATTKPLRIGYQRRFNGAPSFYFNGSMDEIKIFNRIITPEEINASINTRLQRLQANFTGLTDGMTYNYTAYAISQGGMINITKPRTITIDTTAPTINIQSPKNTQSYTTLNLSLNYTISDSSLDKCWYQNFSGTENITLPGCANTTLKHPKDNSYTIKVYANDTLGNTASATSTYIIDTVYPIITIHDPATGSTKVSNSTPFNYVTNETNRDKCWWQNYTGANNISLPGCINITMNITSGNGVYTVLAYVNDTAGHTSSDSTTFTINVTDPPKTLLEIRDGSSNSVIFKFLSSGAMTASDYLYWSKGYQGDAIEQIKKMKNKDSAEWGEIDHSSYGDAFKLLTIKKVTPIVVCTKYKKDKYNKDTTECMEEKVVEQETYETYNTISALALIALQNRAIQQLEERIEQLEGLT